ncbi:hypothetical protein [Kineosporia babensis]|uniref:Uncharacterized protein n=1 Tax=Kineosporia babensis TaxID=499548 RepID=A0A9X1NNT0_9ACTN|nr:hypothetical protein [Kineosporia babensis]MCD5317159.1 hypothetical protein [Kineosporia babensis]
MSETDPLEGIRDLKRLRDGQAEALAEAENNLLSAVLDYIRMREGGGVTEAATLSGWSQGYVRKKAREAGIAPKGGHAARAEQMREEAARRREREA